MRAVEDLARSIATHVGIPGVQRRRDIERELRAHIEDSLSSSVETSRDSSEIDQVLARFGDEKEIAEGFAWVYRHEYRLLCLVALLLMALLLAIGISAAVLLTQAGFAVGEGLSPLRGLGGPHTQIEVLDIVGSVAAYLALTSLESVFEHQAFLKAALLLCVAVGTVFVLLASADHPQAFLIVGLVNGIFCRATQLFVASSAARAGGVILFYLLMGLLMASVRTHDLMTVVTTCASWSVLGTCYLLMTLFAGRLSATLMNRLQRI